MRESQIATLKLIRNLCQANKAQSCRLTTAPKSLIDKGLVGVVKGPRRSVHNSTPLWCRYYLTQAGTAVLAKAEDASQKVAAAAAAATVAAS